MLSPQNASRLHRLERPIKEPGTREDAPGTTWGLGGTGTSGPSGNRYGDFAGHACVAVTGPVERVFALETGDTDRDANMWAFTRAALDLLEACVREAV